MSVLKINPLNNSAVYMSKQLNPWDNNVYRHLKIPFSSDLDCDTFIITSKPTVVDDTYSDYKNFIYPKYGLMEYSYAQIKNRENQKGRKYSIENEAGYETMLRARSLTLDDGVNLWEDTDKYEFDVPERFTIAANNTIRQKGNAHIIDDIPEIFKGLDPEQVMDDISGYLTDPNINFERGVTYSVNIAGKRCYIKNTDGGKIGVIYKVTDDENNTLAIKKFLNGSRLYANCAAQEIPLMRQLSKDKVKDVPNFYMANAADYKYGKNGDTYKDTMWMAVDFIEYDTPVKKEGISFNEWCRMHNVSHRDLNEGTKKGAYFVDVGGTMPDISKFEHRLKERWTDSFSFILPASLKRGMSIDDILQLKDD